MPSSIDPGKSPARFGPGKTAAAAAPRQKLRVLGSRQALEALEPRTLLSGVVFSENFDSPTGANGQVVFKADPIYLADGATPSGGDAQGNSPYLNANVIHNDLFPPFSTGGWGPINQDQGGTGYFLFEGTDNGTAPSFAGKFWETIAPVTVSPNTNYAFSFYLTNADADGGNLSIVQPSINGTPIGSAITAKGFYSDGTSGDGWQKFTVNWNSGSATTADLALSNQQTKGLGNDLGVDTITLAPAPPAVLSVRPQDAAGQGANAGATGGQRSIVSQLVVSFSEPVSLAAGAFTLGLVNAYGSGANNGSADTDASAALGTATNPSGDGVTWVLPVLPGTAWSTAINGAGGTGAATLNDGVYHLAVHAAAVTAVGGGPTMAADYQSPLFHRLYGDTDGNKTVNALDYAKFKQAFGAATGSAAYNGDFDYDGNGIVNALDYAQFKKRFGTIFAY